MEEKVAAWLEKHWKGDKTCAVCQSNSWRIAPDPVEIRPYKRGGIEVGGPVYPLASITCTVCGYTLLFNALVMGVVPTAKEQADALRAEAQRRALEDMAPGKP